MIKSREWFWQIQDMGQGPDFVFIATFVSSDADRLAAVVRDNLSPGFVDNKDFIDSPRRSDSRIYDNYVDQHTHNRFVSRQEHGEQESIWYYGEIEVRDHQLMIQEVLAGGIYGGTSLIIAVSQSPNLMMKEWKVAYNGYSWGEVAQGSSALSLLDYLQFSDGPDETVVNSSS
jgi:hypothetical protein